MMFAFKKFIWPFFTLGNVMIFFLFIAFLAFHTRRGQKTGRRIFTFILAFLFILTLTPVSALFIKTLENQYKVPETSILSDVTGFIVLGGSINEVLSHQHSKAIFNDNGDRLTSMSSLMRTYPDKRFVFTGGSPSTFKGQELLNEAQWVESILAEQNLIEDYDVVFESDSRDTLENSTYSFDLVQPQAEERWVLVTSAYHMPRAMALFKSAGWNNMIAYPIDHRASDKHVYSLTHNLSTFEVAQKEWLGILYYYFTKRIDKI